WFHRAAAEAKKAGAFVFFVPPDTLWTDGSLAQMAKHLASGKRGVACPFILVVSDTCVPDARSRFIETTTGTLRIPPAEMWPFAKQHMHPNQILAMPCAPHSRPVFELHWPVGHNGLLSRYAFRELAAFDPGRIPISFLWCADGPEDLNGIHFASEPEDMFM